MADGRSVAYEPQPAPAAQRGTWAWHPPLPLAGVPVLVWPPRPAAALKYLASLAFLGSFHHQLHHRYYDCNYSNPYIPRDRWLGSNHDGTPQATADLQRRRRERMRPRSGRT